MGYLFNIFYLCGILLLSPYLAFKALTTGKYRRGMLKKFLGLVGHAALDELHRQNRPIVWFHGVSVGEIHLLKQVVARFRQRRPELGCVVSTTTDTGYDEACKIFCDLPVILWPLDFSWAVKRALRTVRPQLVVLAEGEVWPNFLLCATRQAVKIAIINARMSPRSCRRFGRIRWFARRFFSRLDLIAAQTAEYAVNYRFLGAANVHVTGSVKYDGADGNRANARTLELRRLLRIRPGELVWIAGSTQAPEEEVVLGIYRRLITRYLSLRVIIVPRQRDRFEEVAQLLQRSGQPFLRRSQIRGETAGLSEQASPIILVDTIGELNALWGLADIAFVGGSLDGKRGGQNMIEPAAYGAAVLFGPHTWNFKETVTQLLHQQAAIRVADAAELEGEMLRLLNDSSLRSRLGAAASRFVLSQQGATERTLALLDHLLPTVRRQVA